jgi:uncharacterized membrane protein
VHNADIVAVCADQADFGGTDFFVGARAGIALRRRIVRSAGYDSNPSVIAKSAGKLLSPAV